jgi:adenine-specific DNA methylase
MSPEDVDRAARLESRNREVHLPPVSVYRWWARRTEAVNGAVIDAVSIDHPGRLLVADVFAGGGVIPLSAVRRGHRVYAQDLNPWAALGLHTMLSLPSPEALRAGFGEVEGLMQGVLHRAYTTALDDGRPATLSHTFRVATADCPSCQAQLRLYPHAMVTLKRRKERGLPGCFLACRRGHLYEGSADSSSDCPTCGLATDPGSNYTPRREVECVECGTTSHLDTLATSPSWDWEVVLVERTTDRERAIGLPTAAEIAQAATSWNPRKTLPAITDGRETAVLKRHGFTSWHQLYPDRQRVVMEHLLGAIDQYESSDEVRAAMRVAALGVVEMAGLASRWDRWYLKSYETMAAHRFNFTTFTAEPNVWGCTSSGRGTFLRRIASFCKASEWLRTEAGELKVERRYATDRRRSMRAAVDVLVVEGSSERVSLPNDSADLVVTDPPYHDDVQYGQLSLPLRAWAGLPTSDLDAEAVATVGGEAAYGSYQALLTRIFAEARRALKPSGHLIFSYANREPDAWVALFNALHGAGFRAAGFNIAHSENETDHAKRSVRACTLDLILDLVPAGANVETWRPTRLPESQEESFLQLVGHVMMENVGGSDTRWAGEFREKARLHPFIAARHKSTIQ